MTTIIQFEAHADHFLPWDFLLDEDNTIIGKHPHAGAKVIGFAPKDDTDADVTYTFREGWQDKVVGLVPVLIEGGEFFQLTSHVVRGVRMSDG